MRTAISLLLSLAACGGPEPTWHQDVRPVVADRCLSCHDEGGIGPFALKSYDQVAAVASLVDSSVRSEQMPPWPPADDCATYQHDRSLAPGERDVLLDWLEAGLPEGDPETAAPWSVPERGLQADRTLQMAEAYTPEGDTDDYRCHVIDWPEQGAQWVTGFEVRPDSDELVHHVIAYAVDPDVADTFREADGADVRPGYTCFGGPTPPGMSEDALYSSVRWLAAWAPGGADAAFPEGTGIEVQPGSAIVLQVHYNTLESDAAADRSGIAFTLADEVDRPAALVPFTDYRWLMGGMQIPGGEPEVEHSVSYRVGDGFVDYLRSFGADIGEGEPFLIHDAALHMHLLGTRASLAVERADGTRDCQLDIPAWDFDWQESYRLAEPTEVAIGDRLELACTWDNSAANQPIIDGEQLEPRDVGWGEGTTDEMCLAVLYVSGR